jgi:hypothetical protein
LNRFGAKKQGKQRMTTQFADHRHRRPSLQLYHFTLPFNVRSILARGLIARPDRWNGMPLSREAPVVWLTEQRRREDRHYVAKHLGTQRGHSKWLPLSCVRLAVDLPRHLKPMHLVTLYRQNRAEVEKRGFDFSFAERFLDKWWIHFGDIPRRYVRLDGRDVTVDNPRPR